MQITGPTQIGTFGLDEGGVRQAFEKGRLEETIEGYRAKLTALEGELTAAGQEKMLDLVVGKQSDTAVLRETVAALHKAMKMREWAETQTNLGKALMGTAPEGASGTARLEKAVVAP